MVDLLKKTRLWISLQKREPSYCNFARWLQYLTVPEEMYGNWSKVWQQGEVDMLVGIPTTLMQSLWIASPGNSYAKRGGDRIAFLTGRGGMRLILDS